MKTLYEESSLISLYKNNTGATSSLGRRWESINWMKAEAEVKRLQIRIAEVVK